MRFPDFSTPLDPFQEALTAAIRGSAAGVGGIAGHLGNRDQRNRLFKEYRGVGISPRADMGSAFPWRTSDAYKLANLMAFNNQQDPVTQRRFLTMLKQMGYLPQQAQ